MVRGLSGFDRLKQIFYTKLNQGSSHILLKSTKSDRIKVKIPQQSVQSVKSAYQMLRSYSFSLKPMFSQATP
jgi:hypothetical protein